MAAPFAGVLRPVILAHQVRLQKLDVPVGEVLNVNVDVVVKATLIFNVKLESYLRDRLVNHYIAWRGKDGIFHVDNKYDFASVEHAVVHK